MAPRNEIDQRAGKFIAKFKKGLRYSYTLNGDGKPRPAPVLSVHLVMKNDEVDTGGRPLDNPRWDPACIWVEDYSAQGDAGNEVLQPQVGLPYRIAAEVHNMGEIATYSTFLEFYWFDTTPSQPFPDCIHRIGVPKMVSINARSCAIVRSDIFIPTYVNNGHECIVVRASDPIIDPVDFNQYNQVADRHVSQRNLSVVQTERGANAFMPLSIWSAKSTAEEYTVNMSPISEGDLLLFKKKYGLKGETAREPLNYYGLISKEGLRKIRLPDFDISQSLKAFKQPTKPDDIALPLPKGVDSRFRAAITSSLRIKAGKKPLRLWAVQGIPAHAKVDSIYGFTVTQWRGLELVGKLHQIVIVA